MRFISKVVAVVILVNLVTGCSEERINNTISQDLLIGRWNSYEEGLESTGFFPVVSTSLTINYESGFKFLSNGTFRSRFYDVISDTWMESDIPIGTYKLKDMTITLLFSPGTVDEQKFEVELVKLDENHLWIKHSLFVETEYHLERLHN